MYAPNLEDCRYIYGVLSTSEAQNLKEHRDFCGIISQRDAHGQHEVAVKTHLFGRGDRSFENMVALE